MTEVLEIWVGHVLLVGAAVAAIWLIDLAGTWLARRAAPRCDDRLCPTCSARRSREAAARLRAQVGRRSG